ncbi:hypothetical protein GPB2148_2467 [marine gamma proteobacterium HTCC2148]|nr:hypothetical protein GPB2148_2467 [marine gamma proteobacterium HTCC2148]
MAIAGCEYFDRVYAIDFDSTGFFLTESLITIPENLQFAMALNKIDIKLDLVTMWHVLEHLPDPSTFFGELKSKMNTGAILFGQVPCYRPDYVDQSHFAFYNESSLATLLISSNFEVLEIGFDLENSFMSFIARSSKEKSEP